MRDNQPGSMDRVARNDPSARSTSWLRRIWPRGAVNHQPAAGNGEAVPAAIETPQPETVFIGHSHIYAMLLAHRDRVANYGVSGTWRFVDMREPQYEPNIRGSADGIRLNPALVDQLPQEKEARGAPFIIDCISGNEYHFIGLVNHPRRFDFVLPSARDLPLQSGVEILPSTLVSATLRRSIGHAILMMAALRASTSLPIWHVQSPPPVPDEAHIMAYPTTFDAAIKEHGVAPSTLRWKLWRLQSELYREACEQHGITFLDTPHAALDSDGFLRPEFWNPDPTHANGMYGELVLQQIDALKHAGATI